MEFTFVVLHRFFYGVYYALPILTPLLLIILALGQWAGRIEKWDKFTAFYWSLITALTIGFGDVRPVEKTPRMLSILIGILGIMFTGIIVALIIAATGHAFKTVIGIQ